VIERQDLPRIEGIARNAKIGKDRRNWKAKAKPRPKPFNHKVEKPIS
jgi:hypothetical protein